METLPLCQGEHPWTCLPVTGAPLPGGWKNRQRRRVTWDLRDRIAHANLRGACAFGADFTGANFTNACRRGCILHDAMITEKTALNPAAGLPLDGGAELCPAPISRRRVSR